MQKINYNLKIIHQYNKIKELSHKLNQFHIKNKKMNKFLIFKLILYLNYKAVLQNLKHLIKIAL